jgi:hypothetical protein
VSSAASRRLRRQKPPKPPSPEPSPFGIYQREVLATHARRGTMQAAIYLLFVPMDRLFLAVIVSALLLLVFSSALLVDRSQSPVTLIERPEKAKGERP